MADKILARGFEAIGLGALAAGCQMFPGCPTGPEDEVFEWLAQEFPKNGSHFVRASSETSAINMAFGSAAAGGRAMVLVASAGWGLIQETMSHLVNAFVPVVVVLVQRGGPGVGSLRQAQMDYFPVTRDAGHGNYRNIVLAPASVQEMYEFIQLSFHLAHKWRNPVIMATDTIGMRLMEAMEVKQLDFPPLPEKDWTITGKGHHADGARRYITTGQGFIPSLDFPTYLDFLHGLNEKVLKMKETEIRYEGYDLKDAEIVMVAYGYSARICLETLRMARSEGIKAGLLRPLSLWPFPLGVLREKAEEGTTFLVVEDSLGGLDEDVRLAVREKSPIEVMSALDRQEPGEGGSIYPETVLEKIRSIKRGHG